MLERGGCEFYASSPKWAAVDHFEWYKNVPNGQERHQRLIEVWTKFFPFFLTGALPLNKQIEPASFEVINSVSELIEQISAYTTNLDTSIDSVRYPVLLDQYFSESEDELLLRFNSEMRNLYDVIQFNQLDELISTYHEAKSLRELWGSPYHYLCCSKSFDPKKYYPQNNR